MAIWKAKVASGVRFFFKVVDSGGNLRVGLAPGVFTCLVIEPGDAANQAIAIAQSAQQAGLYYGDVPSAFLLANGVGHYIISIGVHAAAPKLDAEATESLEVTQRDLDDLAQPGDQMDLLPAAITDVAIGVLDLPNGVEPGWTLRQSQRIQLSAAAGKTRDFGSNSPKFRDINDTKDRINATQDGQGNRVNVVTDKA